MREYGRGWRANGRPVADGRPWVLESGTGHVVVVNAARGERVTVPEVPGCACLALCRRYAFVGLSKTRATLAMDGVLLAERCDWRSGDIHPG